MDSITSLSEKEILSIIPGLKELNNFTENNNWHDHDNVLTHTFTVFSKLKENSKLLFLEEAKRDFLLKYLNQKVGKYSRKEDLHWAALLHDIAKPEKFQTTNRLTQCPKHEEVGAKKAEKIISKLKFAIEDKMRIVEVIKNHNLPHQLFSPDIDEKIRAQEISKARQNYSQIYVDLLLLGLSDTEGSQLKRLIPEEFKFRINQYYQTLDVSN